MTTYGSIILSRHMLCWDKLAGNVTVSSGFTIFGTMSSSVLSTGLIACDEITQSRQVYNTVAPGRSGPSLPLSSEPWICRNRSIARGIEDLANNITIDLLSIPEMTKTETVLVTTPTPVIRYACHNTKSHHLVRPRHIFIFSGR